mmetsp:Transcript_22759/g.50711  ORF Transcript_22759/g.50711 Transcript_22759/m.50711 type:complete len:142 (+) Transcript_22759:546-971(+)
MAPVCTCNTYLVVRNVDAHDSAKPPQTTIPIEMLRQLQGRYQTFGKHTDNQIVIIAAPLGVLHGYDMNADGCQRLARLAAWRGVVCRISVPSALGPLGRLERRLLSNLGQTGSLFTPSIRRPNFNIVEPQIIVEDKTPPGQ